MQNIYIVINIVKIEYKIENTFSAWMVMTRCEMMRMKQMQNLDNEPNEKNEDKDDNKGDDDDGNQAGMNINIDLFR